MCEDKRRVYLGAGAELRASTPLKVGEYIWMQNHVSLKQNIAARIASILQDRRAIGSRS